MHDPSRSACRSSCWPAPAASTAGSPAPTSRRPASRSPGFHEYLQAGRILLFGESEVRFLESLDAGRAPRGAGQVLHRRIAVPARHRRRRDRAGGRARGRARQRADPADAGADRGGDRQAHRRARGSPRASRDHPRRADRHPRPRRADRRRERHRQERVRARPGRARPSPGRRRHRRSAAAIGIDRDRRVPGADAPPHGGARPRPDQHPRSVRRRVDAHVEAHRAGRAARSLGRRAASTIGSGWTKRRTS